MDRLELIVLGAMALMIVAFLIGRIENWFSIRALFKLQDAISKNEEARKWADEHN
jgi:hypothetical protein